MLNTVLSVLYVALVLLVNLAKLAIGWTVLIGAFTIGLLAIKLAFKALF